MNLLAFTAGVFGIALLCGFTAVVLNAIDSGDERPD